MRRRSPRAPCLLYKRQHTNNIAAADHYAADRRATSIVAPYAGRCRLRLAVVHDSYDIVEGHIITQMPQTCHSAAPLASSATPSILARYADAITLFSFRARHASHCCRQRRATVICCHHVGARRVYHCRSRHGRRQTALKPVMPCSQPLREYGRYILRYRALPTLSRYCVDTFSHAAEYRQTCHRFSRWSAASHADVCRFATAFSSPRHFCRCQRDNISDTAEYRRAGRFRQHSRTFYVEHARASRECHANISLTDIAEMPIR